MRTNPSFVRTCGLTYPRVSIPSLARFTTCGLLSTSVYILAHTGKMKLSPGALFPGSRKYFMGSFSPAGLHVLVVDDDPLCLMVLDRMLRQCNYKVTTCNRVSLALQLLRDNKDDFDLVMSDVYMPDEDGFKLLEVIGLELDLPVIMMSANGETSVVMKGITHGACDYLIKPVRMEELRNIWQHVIRRKGKEVQRGNIQGELDESARGVESQDQCSKKRKEFLETEDCSVDDINSLKKARVNWSIQLHQQFVNAVNQLGVDKAVPKRIVDIMNVQGLTRENVASHLQKYRLYLKRLSGFVPEPCPIASFQASADGTAGGTMMVVQPGGKGPAPNAGVKGLNLGAGVGLGPGRGRKIDAGTMESLVQFKLKQQKQAANRAQVLGGLGLSDARSLADVPAGGLQRMSSLDLSFFLQSKHIDSLAEQSMDALDDLAACSFKTVKLEDDAAIVSGINNKRTYPSRKGQGAVRQGHIAQWNISIRDGSDVADGEEKHKLVGINTGFSEMINPNAGFREMTNPNAGFNKVMGSFAGCNEVIGTKVGFNKAMASNTEFNKVMRTDEVISTDTEFNEVISTNAGNGQPYLHTIQEEMRGGGVYTLAYSSSLLDLADDAASSTNVGNNDLSTGSTAIDMSGEAISESSFDALANLGNIIGPTPLMQNSELDISDYLLDDGFAYQSWL